MLRVTVTTKLYFPGWNVRIYQERVSKFTYRFISRLQASQDGNSPCGPHFTESSVWTELAENKDLSYSLNSCGLTGTESVVLTNTSYMEC